MKTNIHTHSHAHVSTHKNDAHVSTYKKDERVHTRANTYMDTPRIECPHTNSSHVLFK